MPIGSGAASTVPAVWSAAFVFLAMWLPYNNGLRPEPAEAVGALLTWCCVERAIATRRLLPYAVGVVTAAFTLALELTVLRFATAKVTKAARQAGGTGGAAPAAAPAAPAAPAGDPWGGTPAQGDEPPF